MTAMELRLVLRRGENLFATIVIPTLVLVLFSSISILPTGTGRPVDFLLPGSIALGIVATSLVSLGITTAYDRSYGVLKRLGGSPLQPRRADRRAAPDRPRRRGSSRSRCSSRRRRSLLGWSAGPAAGSPVLFVVAVLSSGPSPSPGSACCWRARSARRRSSPSRTSCSSGSSSSAGSSSRSTGCRARSRRSRRRCRRHRSRSCCGTRSDRRRAPRARAARAPRRGRGRRGPRHAAEPAGGLGGHRGRGRRGDVPPGSRHRREPFLPGRRHTR